MKVLGLDLSLSETGLAVGTGDGAVTSMFRTVGHRKPPPTYEQREARLDLIVDHVSLFLVGGTDLVVLEGPSYGSSGGDAFDRAGLWWAVRRVAARRTLPVVIVPPKTRAMYATGRGDADKAAVLAAVAVLYPDVDVSGHNEGDALVLAAIGLRRLGSPLERTPLPTRSLSALDKMRWPDVLLSRPVIDWEEVRAT